MAWYKTSSTDLTTVANAIRTRGGTLADLEFPTGWANAIAAIPSGGGGQYQSKTRNYTPSTTAITETVTPDAGYDGLSSVTVTVTAMTTQVLPTAVSSSGSGTLKLTVTRSTSDQYINIPVGWNSAAAYYKVSAVPNGTAGTPSASKSAVSNHTVTVTPTVTNSTGYISGGTKTGTGVTVSASELVSGDLPIVANASSIDVTNYQTVSVSVPAGGSIQTSKSVTPSETAQTVTPDSGYDGMAKVLVSAISSDYVGSGITRRTAADMTLATRTSPVKMATVIAPAGYYADNYGKQVTIGTEGTPTATKGAVSNHSVQITPSVTNTEGYIFGENPTGTPVTVTAAELVSGNLPITANGNNIDVTNYETVSVNVSGGGGGPTLLSTTSLGALSTSSTSATNTNKTLSLASSTGWANYDLLIVDISVDTETNNRHTSTVSMVLVMHQTSYGTPSNYTVVSNKWNSKKGSSGTGSTRQSTTAYGVYVNSVSVSNGTMSLPIYYRYNNNNTGTINGTYTARIYGVKLYDLIGG